MYPGAAENNTFTCKLYVVQLRFINLIEMNNYKIKNYVRGKNALQNFIYVIKVRQVAVPWLRRLVAGLSSR